MARIFDMKQKEVINGTDGVRLGFISDIEVDFKEGKVIKIFVPGPTKLFGMLGSGKEYEIPWHCIKKIGEDVILVDIDVEKALRETDY